MVVKSLVLNTSVGYHFLKEHRLLKGTEFQAVRGTRLTVSTPSILILAKPNTFTTARLGLAISKRSVKLAVQRNLIKRIARESFRYHAANLPPIDIVLMVRPPVTLLTKSELRQCIDELWQQLAKRAQRLSLS